jgi:hypothetical protein
MRPFQEVMTLKLERERAKNAHRIDEIDARIKALEPELTHEEAVYIVKRFEIEKTEPVRRSA